MRYRVELDDEHVYVLRTQKRRDKETILGGSWVLGSPVGLPKATFMKFMRALLRKLNSEFLTSQ